MDIINQIPEFYNWFRDWVGALPGGEYYKRIIVATTFGFFCLCVIGSLEKLHGINLSFYRSRNFLHDVGYWFYYRLGLANRILLGPFLYVVGSSLDTFKLDLLTGMHFVPQIILLLLIGDFFGYWIHRMQHAVPLLWAFHTTHHSQRDLNFASTTRFHPIEHFIQNVLMVIPLLILGADVKTVVVYYYAMEFNAALQHSRLPWRYGPLYYVVSSPAFHNFHHSRDAAHRDKNFAGFFTFYDFLFGTAVDEKKPPEKLGLEDVNPQSFLQTLYLPFLIIARQFKPRKNPVTIETQIIK